MLKQADRFFIQTTNQIQSNANQNQSNQEKVRKI